MKPQPALGIAKPTETLRPTMGVSKKKLLHPTSATNNAKNLHSELSSSLNIFLKKKSTLELALKQKERKITFLQETVELHNEMIRKLQVENEKLSTHSTNDEQLRNEVLQKFIVSREQCMALKQPFEELNNQLNNCSETCRMIDASTVEREMKFNELHQNFVDLSMAHQEKLSVLSEALKVHEQESLELKRNLSVSSIEHNRQVEALNRAIEDAQHEISRYQKLLLEADTGMTVKDKEKEKLVAELTQLKLSNDEKAKELTDQEKRIEKLEDEIKQVEENYMSACCRIRDLQIANADLEDKVKRWEVQSAEQRLDLENRVSEIAAECSKEQQRTKEALSECDALKNELCETETQRKKLEAEIENAVAQASHEKSLREQETEKFKECLNAMSEEKNALAVELQNSKQKLNFLMSENQAARELYENQINEEVLLKTEITELKNKVALLESQKQVEVQQMKDAFDLCKQELVSSREENKHLAQLHETQVDISEKLKSEVDELQNKIHHMELQDKEHSELTACLHLKLKECEEDCTLLKSYKAEIERALNEKESQLVEMEQNYMSSAVELKSQLLEKTKELDELKAEKSAQQKELIAKIKELDDVKSKILSLESKADASASLSTELGELLEELKQKSNELTESEQMVHNLQEELKEKEKTVKSLEKNNASLKSSFDSEKASSEKHRRDCDKHVAKLSELQQTLIDKEEFIKNLQSRISKLKRDMRDEKVKSRSSSKEHDDLSEKSASLEKEIVEKDKMIFQLKEEALQLKKQLEEKFVEEEESKSKISEEIGQLKNDRQNYFMKYTQLQKQYSQENVKTGFEIVSLKEKIEMLEQQLLLKEVEISKLLEEALKKQKGDNGINVPENKSDDRSNSSESSGNKQIRSHALQKDKGESSGILKAKTANLCDNKRSGSMVTLKSPAMKRGRAEKENTFIEPVPSTPPPVPSHQDGDTSGSEYLDFELNEKENKVKFMSAKKRSHRYSSSVSSTPAFASQKIAPGSRGSSRKSGVVESKKAENKARQMEPPAAAPVFAKKLTPKIFKDLLSNDISKPRKFFSPRTPRKTLQPNTAKTCVSSAYDPNDPFAFGEF